MVTCKGCKDECRVVKLQWGAAGGKDNWEPEDVCGVWRAGGGWMSKKSKNGDKKCRRCVLGGK